MKPKLLTFILFCFALCSFAYWQVPLCPKCHKPKTKCICKPNPKPSPNPTPKPKPKPTPKPKELTYTITKDDRSLCEIDEKGNLIIPRSITKNGKTYLVIEIGERAFEDCTNFTKIIIPSSVTRIERNAFNYCKKLTSLVIPKGVIQIEGGAFSFCPNLISIEVDKGNPIYDSRDNCNAIIETKTNTLLVGCNTSTIPYSVTSIGYSAFGGSKISSINIPNSVTSIDREAFYFCNNLTNINIPSSVTAIGFDAFCGCCNLLHINIPSSVSEIHSGIFNYCPNLTRITVDKENPSYDSRDNCNAIIETKTNTLIAGCNTSTIPYSVTSIGHSAFGGSEISNINIPSSVITIHRSAFEDCNNIASLYIPNSVTTIGSHAFRSCDNLTDINIPSSLIKLEGGAFLDCTKLRAINCIAIKPPLTEGKFPTNTTIHVPRGCANAYKQAKYWKDCTIVDDL